MTSIPVVSNRNSIGEPWWSKLFIVVVDQKNVMPEGDVLRGGAGERRCFVDTTMTFVIIYVSIRSATGYEMQCRLRG